MSVSPGFYPQSSAANVLCAICIHRDTWWLFVRSRPRLWPQARTVLHNDTWTSSYLPISCSPLGISLPIWSNYFSFSHFPPSTPFLLVSILNSQSNLSMDVPYALGTISGEGCFIVPYLIPFNFPIPWLFSVTFCWCQSWGSCSPRKAMPMLGGCPGWWVVTCKVNK